MYIKGERTEYIKIKTGVKEVLECIIKEFKWESKYDSYVKYDESTGYLTRYEDTSYHGSPSYKPVDKLTNNKEDIELFDHLTKALKIIKNKERSK